MPDETSLITEKHLDFEQKAKIAENTALDLLMRGEGKVKPVQAQAWATLALSFRTAAQTEALSETMYRASGQV